LEVAVLYTQADAMAPLFVTSKLVIDTMVSQTSLLLI